MDNISFKYLLEELPSGSYKNVSNVLTQTMMSYSNDDDAWILDSPPLELFCDNEFCKGIRSFEHELYPYTVGDPRIVFEPFINCCHILDYICSNCKSNMKYFALYIEQLDDGTSADVVKFGEYPKKGMNVHPKLLSIIGLDQQLFLNGRHCESMGYGIGALTYYRRIIENQRNRLYDFIIKTLAKIENQQENIKQLEAAKKEKQFSNSISSAKEYIPKELFIEGYNPLTLLHNAMSKGVHNMTDIECLEIAESIRLLLSKFSEKLSEVSAHTNKIKEAVKKLNNINKSESKNNL